MPNTTSLTLTVSDLVFDQGEQIRTSSLKVAEEFNKQHKDVIRKLKSLECSDEFTERNFTLSEYKDSSGRKLSMFEMTKDGFMFLVMGFTGKKAAAIKEAYINAFNQMANQLHQVSLPIKSIIKQSNWPTSFRTNWNAATFPFFGHTVHYISFVISPTGNTFRASFSFQAKDHQLIHVGQRLGDAGYFESSNIEELWEQVIKFCAQCNSKSAFL